jgi:prepilin-type N-terminal cleavage/methylation domain-containing protein
MSNNHSSTTYHLQSTKYSKAFTIVELLVVIVVIGILAAITIVSYTGISGKATVSSIQSELSNAKKQLNLYYVDHGLYPKSLNASNCPVDTNDNTDNKYCIKYSTGTTYVYTPNNTTAPTSFCITTTANSISYIVTDTTSPKQGDISSFGLVGYWALDNTTGITDLSLSGNNGTAYGGIAIGTAVDHRGVANKATTFDGSNDYVNVADSAVFNTKPLTVCVWARPASFTNHQSIIAKQRSGDSFEQIGLLVDSTGNVAFQSGASGTSFKGPLILNVWAHICGSSNGTTVTIYINAQVLGTGGDDSTYGATKPFRIGNTQWGGDSRYFNGSVDHVRIYNRALSQIEITNLYNSN